jgi:hypothetical protein
MRHDTVNDRTERIWRCQCGDDHFLSVLRYGDDPEGCLSLIDGTNCHSFRCRVKAAWSILRGGGGYGHYGVEIVLSPDTSRELIAELQEKWPAAHDGEPVERRIDEICNLVDTPENRAFFDALWQRLRERDARRTESSAATPEGDSAC